MCDSRFDSSSISRNRVRCELLEETAAVFPVRGLPDDDSALGASSTERKAIAVRMSEWTTIVFNVPQWSGPPDTEFMGAGTLLYVWFLHRFYGRDPSHFGKSINLTPARRCIVFWLFVCEGKSQYLTSPFGTSLYKVP